MLLALALLGESIHLLQFLGITAIVAGVMFMYREQRQNLQRWSLWMLSLPLAAAVIRGAVQPVIKLGLEHWPNPIAAVVIGYTISSAVLIFAAFVHDPKLVRRFDRRGALWFARSDYATDREYFRYMRRSAVDLSLLSRRWSPVIPLSPFY